jgi:hypothetical protein
MLRILRGFPVFVRYLVLIAALCGAGVLWHWNRTADPRFYYFLETQPGKIIGSMSGWDIFQPNERKTDGEMTHLELGYKRSLERVVNYQYPTHLLQFKDGTVLRGQVVEQEPEAVQFRPVQVHKALEVRRIPRSHISMLAKNSEMMLPVSYRDVRFKMEFPDLKFYRNGGYTILTDASGTDTQSFVGLLDALYVDFGKDFASLMEGGSTMRDIQVVYVYEKGRFASYRPSDQIAPSDTTGMYLPDQERLIIYNQRRVVQSPLVSNASTADQFHAHEATNGPEWLVKKSAKTKKSPLAYCRFRSGIDFNDGDETYLTLRHEGAHHLAFKRGVHSSFRAENSWLVEGLACYFESEVPGDVVHAYRRMLRWGTLNNEFIPLDQLVNYRSSDGMVDSSSPARIDMSYAESWALVRFLMQDEYRPGFFNYIEFVRDSANLNALGKQPRVKLLAAHLNLSVSQLDARWLQYLHQVVKSAD